MCGPAAIPFVMMAASAAMTAYSKVKSDKANQAIADNNEKIARWKADDAIQRGNVEAQNKYTETALRLGRARALAATNGGLVDFGSNLDILADTTEAGKLDVLTIRSNAQREAFGNIVAANDFAFEAKQAQQQATMDAAIGAVNTESSMYGKGGFMSNTPSPLTQNKNTGLG